MFRNKFKTKEILVVGALILLIAGMQGWNLLNDYKRHNFRAKTVLLVYPDMNAKDVEKHLIQGGYVARPASLKRAFRRQKVGLRLKPGRYEILPHYTSIHVARMLTHGWQSPAELTLSGTIRSRASLAAKISRQMMVDSASIDSALRNSALLATFGFDTTNVFSLFIPDTYEINWTASVEDIFKKFQKEYTSFWTDGKKELAKEQGLTPLQVSILASIVNGETRYEPEMPSIAGVYLNRLHSGMKLQADPTVAYCYGYKLNRILGIHTQCHSRYNTYMYPGLPPGPICVPSKAALNAVLNPDTNGYMFFCASPAFDGTHLFATSFGEHSRNARAFQRALDARNITK
jgi:UPF0755 protein